MSIWDPRRVIVLSAVAAALWACGDDADKGAGPDDPTAGKGGGTSSAGKGSATAGKANSAGSGGSAASIDDGGEGGIAGGPGPIDDGGEAGQASVGGSGGNSGGSGGSVGGSSGSGGSAGGSVSPYPTVPSALALSGCSGVGPICSVTQDKEKLNLKCGARAFTGTIQENGNYTLTGAPVTSGTTTVTTTNTTCTGQVRPSGVTGTCENTVSPPPSSGSATTTCTLAVTSPLPGLSCLELPSKFSNFEFDSKNLGVCTTIQANCNFQANCADGVVVGTVSKTGASFNYTLAAKAAAGAPEGTTPTFAQGAQVSHSCVTELTANTLQGSCSAGAYSARGVTPIPATSVYDFEAKAAVPVPVCSALGPFSEHLFVLDSCPLLKDGEGEEPGIGEPICSLQQNGCVWKVSCMTDPAKPLVFSGKLAPGQTSASWRLSTGTPCEATFDSKGNLTGKCTVPGQTACNLSSKAPAPAVGCPKLATKFSSLGCGNDTDGIPLDCRKTLQHGCNFAAICDFNTSRFPDSVFAGKTSTENGVDYMKFPGLSGRSCTVQKATAAEIENPANCRAAGEWYGDCLTPTGGGCANSFQCVADANGVYPAPKSNIRRGLRLWFE